MVEHDLAFASVATIRVLLVPVQPIKRDLFAQHCELIRRFPRVSLRDVPVDPRGPAAQLSAQPFSRGSVLFDYVDSYSKAQSYLEEFQVSRRVLGVIGICQCEEWDSSLDEARAEFQRVLGQHPQALAHRCYAFDPPEGLHDNVEGLVVVPSVGDLNFYISTLLADFAASLLHKLSNLASYLDTRSTVSTPQDQSAARPLNFRRSTLPDLPSKSGSASFEPFDRVSASATPPPTSSSSNSGARSSATSRLSSMGTEALAAADRSSKRKMQSRLLKMKADLRALAGRWDEAQAMYEEAINTFRLTSDDVWLASALESSVMLAVVKLWYNFTADPSLHSSTGPSTSRPASAQAPPFAPSALREQLDRLTQVVPLYAKALTLDSQVEDQTPPLLYTEACLRAARALYSVWSSSGYNLNAVEAMVRPRQALEHKDADATLFLQRTLASLVQRSAIAEQVSMAITIHSISISLIDRLRICAAAATLYSGIGYARKRASVLREAVALVSEAAMQAKSSSRRVNGSTSSLVRALPEADGNSSAVHLLRTICRDFGIDLVDPPLKREAGQARLPLRADQDQPDPFGWGELQMSVVKDCILSARMLSDYTAALQLVVSTLKYLSAPLAPEEQLRLAQQVPELTSAARRRGLDVELDFWGPRNMVVGMQIQPPENARLVQEHPIAHADPQAEQKLPKNPYVYNPKAKLIADQTRLVQDEIVEVLVTLQNPFLFEVEILGLRLSTSGIRFEATPLTVTLAPGSLHTFRLSGCPLETGLLTLRGVFMRMSDTIEREFVLPSSEAQTKNAAARVSAVAESERIKEVGLQALRKSVEEAERDAKDSTPAFMECRVVPSQPFLRVTSTSLTHGALMLYDGETANLEIELENLSSLPVDLCRLTFQDNHSTDVADQLLNTEVELPPGEAHELDWELHHKSVLSWAQQPESFRIEPGHRSTLNIQCHGKYGCMEGLITINYASVHRDHEQADGSESGTFFTRTILCPVVFTVHRAVDAGPISLEPLQALKDQQQQHRPNAPLMRRQWSQSVSSQLDYSLEASPRTLNHAKHCLLVVAATNVFNRPFEVTLENTDAISGEDTFSMRQRVEAGSTINFIARLPRIHLTEEETERPIPAPRAARQYVVSAARNRMSQAEQSLERTLFWYRERFLSMLRASWKEIGSRRRGDVHLRGLRLTLPMLDVLRSSPIHVEISPASSNCRKVHKGLWKAPVDELVDVNITVSGATSALSLTLGVFSVAPTAASDARAVPSEFALVDGTSTFDIPAADSHDEKAEHQIHSRVLFLSDGFFALRGTVHDVETGQRAEGSEITVLVV